MDLHFAENLRPLGWDEFFARQPLTGEPGRLALAEREQFLVWTARGEVRAKASGMLRYTDIYWPCVGDWVALRDGGVIDRVLRRRTRLVRKAPGKAIEEQVLAANIDVLFVVSGLDNDYNPRRIERYLVLARESGARPVVVLNKADLRADAWALVARTQDVAPGTDVIAVSALEGWGIAALGQFITPGKTAALIGSSGAGKSTILNRLLGEERQSTQAVRESDSRGRHTTTRRELVMMPGGWLLMDLPGLRELQIWADPEQVDEAFADVVERARECRFRNCSHTEEPGCAVKDAIDAHRLENYRKLTREAAYLDRREDHNAQRAMKRFCKITERAMRRHPKR